VAASLDEPIRVYVIHIDQLVEQSSALVGALSREGFDVDVDGDLADADVVVQPWARNTEEEDKVYLHPHAVVIAAFDLVGMPLSLVDGGTVYVGWPMEDAALRRLGQLIRLRAPRSERFSRTVRGVRDDLAGEGPVTALQLVDAFKKRHRDYAGLLTNANLSDAPDAWRQTTEDWILDVALRTPPAEMVDGGTVVLGVIKLEQDRVGQLSEAVQQAVAKGQQAPPSPPPPPPNQAAAPQPPPTRREDTRLQNDDPATIDRLQRKPVARFLAVQLQQLQAERPHGAFLVHLDGPWGSGKSTLLRFVEQLLPDDWLIVRFDAWRQSKAGPPWLMLQHGLRRALQKRHSHRLRFWVRERTRLLRRSGYGWALALVVVLVAVLVFLIVRGHGDLTPLDWVIKGTTAFATAAGAGLALSRIVSLDSQRGSQAFQMNQADPMESVANQFSWLLTESKQPVLFLIDDLDRCDRTYVVDLLDAVQKLVRETPVDDAGANRPAVLFLVAADGRWLRNAYQVSHADFVGAVGEAGRPLGSLFLDKIFQVTVPVPSMSPQLQRDFLDHLLSQSDDGTEPAELQPDPALLQQIDQAEGSTVVDAVRQYPQVERVKAADAAISQLLLPQSQAKTEHELQQFAPWLEANPRSMKRFVMAFTVARAVSLAEGHAVPLESLALWTILMLRWPRLAEYLRNDPDAVAHFARPAKLPECLPADLHTLFTEPSLALKALMNNELAPLNAATIRNCCGLT
jgi:energy-coupling factor transporter ATP-binding protein EcfA2